MIAMIMRLHKSFEKKSFQMRFEISLGFQMGIFNSAVKESEDSFFYSCKFVVIFRMRVHQIRFVVVYFYV